jgi:hypothetical protein
MLDALIAATALAASPDAEQPLFNPPGKPWAVRLHAEVGFLATLSHVYQVGAEGTLADVREDYGQNTLFPFLRFSGDLDVGRNKRHTIVLLYQPLDLRTEPTLPRDLVVGDVTFPRDTALDFRYGFDFWRVSWMMDTLKRNDQELALGLGLQIRNANLVVAAKDGSALVATRDVGPVPLLQLRGRGTVKGRFWMGGEAAGFWAPIRYLNGTGADVEGAIADVALRFGAETTRGADVFLSLRYLGGGAVGTSSSADPRTDGFTENWLHFLTLSVGATLR